MTVEVDSASLWPADAEDIDEAVLSNWFVTEGSTVTAGETIGELMIEKVTVDIPAPTDGTVAALLVEETDVFTRGDPLVRVEPA